MGSPDMPTYLTTEGTENTEENAEEESVRQDVRTSFRFRWHGIQRFAIISARMEFTYELTQQDFLDAFLAHRRRSVRWKWIIRPFVFLFFPLRVCVRFYVATYRNSQTLSTWAPLLMLSVLWIAALWGTPWWSARRQFRNRPGAKALERCSWILRVFTGGGTVARATLIGSITFDGERVSSSFFCMHLRSCSI